MRFEYYSPTKIFFGVDEENKVGSIIKNYGFRKVLLHYGTSSIKSTGLYDKIVKSLNDSHVNFVELGGVLPNPDITLVRQGIELCKKENIDTIYMELLWAVSYSFLSFC